MKIIWNLAVIVLLSGCGIISAGDQKKVRALLGTGPGCVYAAASGGGGAGAPFVPLGGGWGTGTLSVGKGPNAKCGPEGAEVRQ